MAGAKFYYSTNDSLGEVAAKSASDSSVYTTPKYVFTIHNYYADTDANYEYIEPRTSTGTYGGWSSHDYHAIAQDKFYYASSSDAYKSFKFVHKLSAPLLKKASRSATWYGCQAPFEYIAMGANSSGYGAKIYWDNSNNEIKVDVLNSDGTKKYTRSWQGYGVFILLSGAGGGGGGGDNEVLLQGRPGGGGGGGGGTALIYFDAKEAYDYSKNSYLLISIGTGGAGGPGGKEFSDGHAGVDSEAKLKNSSGTTMCSITCGGGKGGAGHSWDAAADSAGGVGGIVVTSNDNTAYSTILKLLDSVSGGDGGAGKRNSDGSGSSGNGTASGSWKIPFKDSWKKRDTFSSGSKTYDVGEGGSNNIQGGGGGGCSAGYTDSSAKTDIHGCGMGGYGGWSGQAGAAGLNGFCGIFYNYIPVPDATSGCIAKKVS